MYVDRALMLFGTDKELADALEKISINGEEWHDNFLVAEGMSATWRARGKIPEFFVKKEGTMLLVLFSLIFPLFSLLAVTLENGNLY